MQVKIVGIQQQDYQLDSGYSFKGQKVYAIDLDSACDDLVGNLVMDFKIPANSPMAAVPLTVNKVYTVYFNQKGKPDYLAESK